MSDNELEEYLKTIEPNFDSHIEKGTIEMSNEYYNLLEERMIRLLNENKQLKELKYKFFDNCGEEESFTLEDYLEISNKLYDYEQENKQLNSILTELEEYLVKITKNGANIEKITCSNILVYLKELKEKYKC